MKCFKCFLECKINNKEYIYYLKMDDKKNNKEIDRFNSNLWSSSIWRIIHGYQTNQNEINKNR